MDDLAVWGVNEHGHQPEMTFVNVLSTQDPTLELF